MNNQNNVWKVGVWVGVLLAVFLAVLSIKEIKSVYYVGKNTNISNIISVNGKGEAYAIPDIAVFSFGVTETAKTVAEAQSKSADKTNRILSSIKSQGVADKDIKTISYSINPHYEYINGICNEFRCPPGESKLSGYDVSQTIEVKVRDIEKAGAILSAIGSIGVQNVSGLSFSVDDIEFVRAKARAEAIENAKNKVKEIAKDLGVRIVGVTSFYDNSDQPGPVAYGGFMDKAMAVSSIVPEVPVGEQKVIVNVNISYEIK